mmetsp:Transcript_1160/g.4061  ORF Transcript_1160/g.4061 Transcript_1160/m.4061 type:complete len:212 (+) Transcript_1160:2133-2768(+)
MNLSARSRMLPWLDDPAPPAGTAKARWDPVRLRLRSLLRYWRASRPAPAPARHCSTSSRSEAAGTCSEVSSHVATSLSLSDTSPLGDVTTLRTCALSALPEKRSSSTDTKLSICRSLISFSSAVATLVCLSIVLFLSVSSGSELTAFMRFLVLACRSSSPSEAPPPAPEVCALMAAMSLLYLLSCSSTSSATLGKGLPPFSSQKKSPGPTS